MKYAIKLHPVTILWFGLTFPATRTVANFCRHRMVAMPAEHMSKQNKTDIYDIETFHTNLSLFEVPYFLLHDRQTLFERRFAGFRRDNLILLLHTKRRHFSHPHNFTTMCFAITERRAPTPRQPAADNTVSFTTIVPFIK